MPNNIVKFLFLSAGAVAFADLMSLGVPGLLVAFAWGFIAGVIVMFETNQD